MVPKIIKGKTYRDERGLLTFNNDFNAIEVKRVYTMENKNIDFKRGWQGHKIEQRWLSAMLGSFKITIVSIDFFNSKDSQNEPLEFLLNSEEMDILHVPPGYLSCIQSLEQKSKLLLMSDYMLGEINDEIKFKLK